MNQHAVSLEQAQQLIFDAVHGLAVETTPIAAALGKVLAEDILAPVNVPNFRRSAFDGFALRAQDLRGATPATPIKIQIVDAVPAGDTRIIDSLPAKAGVKIMTGAPMPSMTDLVIKKEDVLFEHDELLITTEIPANTNVLPVGNDIRQGALVFNAGATLTPYHVGALAGLGLTQVQTYQAPRVAVLSTGSELKAPGESLEFGQIFGSNQITLLNLIQSLGGIGCGLGIIADHLEEIKAALADALKNFDLVITTGGTSMGDYDFIQQILEDIGAEILFTRLDLRPGRSTIAAKYQNTLVFGLTGNPAGAATSFELLIRPLLKKLRGEKNYRHQQIIATLSSGWKKPASCRRIIPVHVNYENNQWVAAPLGKAPGGALTALVNCNGLADIPADTGPLAPGTPVTTLLLT